MNNVPDSIKEKTSIGLHMRMNHPLEIVKRKIYGALPDFQVFDDFPSVVPITDNFDLLRIQPDHPSRSPSDTYYWDDTHVLRTHTSAHQIPLLKAGKKKFLVTGDVYRKDEIDATHYPVFHQMEGVKILPAEVDAMEDLKQTVETILEALFPGAPIHWKDDYFPFTVPSYEVEVEIQSQRTELLGSAKMKVEVPDGTVETKRMEVLGCGVIHPEVLKNAGLEGAQGWAFGLGLERLAMKLFQIPDIRLFWSKDQRFLGQTFILSDGTINKFQPFSKHPACYKDISMWVPEGWQKNELMEVIRDTAGDLVEEVKEIDSFQKDGRTSKCYRILYRSMERTLSNAEIDALQLRIRFEIQTMLKVELR